MDCKSAGHENSAVLRSDAPIPYLTLWELELGSADSLPELQDSFLVRCGLRGQDGGLEFEMYLDRDELASLVDAIEQFMKDRPQHFRWANWDQQITVEIEIEYDHVGPPVLCKAGLRQTAIHPGCTATCETYESSFYSNLGWVASFLRELQVMLRPV